MMGQVKSWISKAIPTGMNISQADNMDPVARHSIFSNSVRPRIETELTEYRFGFLSLLSNQLMMMPHRTTSFRSTHASSSAFEFNAKAKSVAPLAIDADSKELMDTADKMSVAYAMMINNMKLLAENKPGRYELMTTNFNEAADALKGLKRYDVVRQRLEALGEVAKGIAFLESGNAVESRVKIQSGLELLEKAKQNTMTNMDFGSTYLAVEKEAAVTGVILNIVETALYDPSTSPLETLEILKRVMTAPTTEYKSAGTDWRGMFGSTKRFIEIFGNMSSISASRAGKDTISVAGGAGSMLMPFWSVDLRYTFVTGALFGKKSVEVREYLLVPASFVTSPESLDNPRGSITDIFASRSGGFLSGIKGSEKSISESGEIGTVIRSAADGSASGRKAIVPVSTKKEAESFVLAYLRQQTTDSSKLKLIKPTVDKLIYIPCEITDASVSLPSLGKMAPKSVGRIETVRTLYM